MEGVVDEWIKVSPERCFFFGCGSSSPPYCWSVVLIGLEQQLWTYESSRENCQVPVNVELEVVGDEVRCEDGGVWR